MSSDEIKEKLKNHLWQNFDRCDITDVGQEAIMIHVSKNGKGLNKELNVEETKRELESSYATAFMEDLKYRLLIDVTK